MAGGMGLSRKAGTYSSGLMLVRAPLSLTGYFLGSSNWAPTPILQSGVHTTSIYTSEAHEPQSPTLLPVGESPNPPVWHPRPSTVGPTFPDTTPTTPFHLTKLQQTIHPILDVPITVT